MDNYYEEGLAHLSKRDYLAAIEAFSKAIRLTLGDIADVYLARSEAYGYLGQWEQAIADCNIALQHSPYRADLYNQRANLRRFYGDLAGAIEDHTMALRIEPAFYEAYYNRALAYEELRQYPLAEADLTETIRLNPGTAPAYEARGRVRAAMHKDLEAIEDYQRYLRMGGGREYDNHGEVLSAIWSLRLRLWMRRLLRRHNP